MRQRLWVSQSARRRSTNKSAPRWRWASIAPFASIITTDLRLNEPRYVSLPGLMKARRKPIEILTCDHLRITVRPLTTVLSTTRPPKRATGTRVESVEELVVKLRQEAKVL